ncbi:MAG: universal stress protein [Halothiobacillaceae bacterium]
MAPQADLILLHAFDSTLEGTLRYAGVTEERATSTRWRPARRRCATWNCWPGRAGLEPHGYQRIALTGHPPTCILEQEEEKDADLIVIGKHGKGAGEELLLGSTTHHVLTESRGDVFVAR